MYGRAGPPEVVQEALADLKRENKIKQNKKTKENAKKTRHEFLIFMITWVQIFSLAFDNCHILE